MKCYGPKLLNPVEYWIFEKLIRKLIILLIVYFYNYRFRNRLRYFFPIYFMFSIDSQLIYL